MIRLYTFLIFVAIVVALLYVVFVVSQPSMNSKITLLAVGESVVIASNMDNVVNNVIYIANISLSNDSLIKENNIIVNIDRIKETDLINIVISGNSRDEVILVKNDILKIIVHQIRHYYPKENLSLHVVENGIAKQNNFFVITPYIFMIFVAVGIIAAILLLFSWYDRVHEEYKYDDRIDGEKIFAGFNKVDEKEDNTEQEEMHGGFDDSIADDLIAEEQKEVLSHEMITEEDDLEKSEDVLIEGKNKTYNHEVLETSREISMPEGLVTTPGNLPVVDASDFGLSSKKDVSPVKTDINQDYLNDSSQELTEPTEEELKARLNELLSGKL